MVSRKPLKISLLGEFSVERDGAKVALPPSRKTRALLAYLLISSGRHRRDRLCELFWDVTDDPRAALRWSLSKIRSLVDDDAEKRIIADRQWVELRSDSIEVDQLRLTRREAEGIETATLQELEEAARLYRGEFLEGMDLVEFHEFHSWCVAEREEARRRAVRVLESLLERLTEDPKRALAHARTLVRIDALREGPRAKFIRLLARTGFREEAAQQFEVGQRLFADLGSDETGELERTWKEVRQQASAAVDPPADAVNAPSASPAQEDSDGSASRFSTPQHPPQGASHQPPLAGRAVELERIYSALQAVMDPDTGCSVLLLTGEPGCGKSRLLQDLIQQTHSLGGRVFRGAAYEARRGRPYALWVDAVRALSATGLASEIRSDLAPLFADSISDHESGNRDRLFAAVVESLRSACSQVSPLLIVLDDMQWCDSDSAELLHYLVRMSRAQPCLVALAARSGELQDNQAMTKAIRELRRLQCLEQLRIPPLHLADTVELVCSIAPQANGKRIFSQSGGNPLFILELARAFQESDGESEKGVPRTLAELVLDRIERLASNGVEVLRWAAVFGPTFEISRLRKLNVFTDDALLDALEITERRGLLSVTDSADSLGESQYRFSHELVRTIVYNDLSAPRRRRMHLEVAQVLQSEERADETSATDIAYHASLAGDNQMAARACVVAGERCLRLFANAEAFALARRGLHYADQLNDRERTKLTIDLTDISHRAHRPENLTEASDRAEALADRAMDHGCFEHARLGYHIASYLRWEGGEWSAAHRRTMQATAAARSGDEEVQVVAMAESARCLAILERDLGQAEALLLEADARSSLLQIAPAAIHDTRGMLKAHAGRYDAAAEQFGLARTASRTSGDRHGEFQALEHLVMVELERGAYEEAAALTTDLMEIAVKLREGSEVPFSRVLAALVRYGAGETQAAEQLDQTLTDLRNVDAKHRLAYALSRAAWFDLKHGTVKTAKTRAHEALTVAQALGRTSETALALGALERASAELGESKAQSSWREQLDATNMAATSAFVRKTIESGL